jgi:hypothetical protein
LARRCSTTELLPLWSSSDSNDSMFVVKRAGFPRDKSIGTEKSIENCG